MLRASIKQFLGHVPAAAALYDAVRPGRPRTRYNLEQLAAHLPAAVAETRRYVGRATTGKKVLLLATLHYWIEQAAMVGLALRGLGYDVSIAYLPYGNWDKEINAFDLKRQDLYTRRVLAPLDGLITCISLLDTTTEAPIPPELEKVIAAASAFDVMYTLQIEDVDESSSLYQLRMRRNAAACQAALTLLSKQRPTTVLIPNGLVTELGVFFRVAEHLGVRTVTYEFNDQREQIWIAQDDIVMYQATEALWQARGGTSLTDEQREKIAALEEARSSGGKYGKGTRAWQDSPKQGSDRLRTSLGLDNRPVILLATNVLGDSLTLGRNLFSTSMAEWIEGTVRHLASRNDCQLLIRIHPGERLIKGPSMTGVVERAAPGKPAHIHVIAPTDSTNTYDLMGIADVGLVYTTTVGLEMAMRGVPVVVAGVTHYRQRGFTIDPETWEQYLSTIDDLLKEPGGRRLKPEQIETAWNYAYRFFFEYPFDFPWRLMHFWKDIEVWPIQRVLSEEGKAQFGATFAYLAGEKIAW